MNEYRDKLIKLYLKTESDIINEIARLRSLGFADYHVVAALKRVRQILNSMKTEAWEWSPKAIEYEFYAYHPEARTMPTTARAALRAYMAAGALTGVQHQIVDRLIISLMAELDEAADTAYQSLADYIVGRDKPDVWREIGLNHAAYGRAAAQPLVKRQGWGELFCGLCSGGGCFIMGKKKGAAHWRHAFSVLCSVSVPLHQHFAHGVDVAGAYGEDQIAGLGQLLEAGGEGFQGGEILAAGDMLA